ncbi:MAG TPA: hypothetical protein VKE24_00445 [Candidatus Acidoferrales bacterium]|nr:hypothetical protein [Candidatus Acidoferrales bacterium]
MSRPARVLSLYLFWLLTWPIYSGYAQDEIAAPRAQLVLGLETVKPNAKGKLILADGALRFDAGKANGQIPIAAIEDVFTGDDSRRAVGGTLGTLAMFAPYGGGRFLSLFRSKIDVLTIKYRDANGALHGAIFSMPKGEAAKVKARLVGQGAHVSIPVEAEGQSEKPQPEKKP